MTIKKTILKVLVGSRAHGLADDDSDYDYRGVFVVPTTEILKLGGNIKNTHWVEGDNDNTSWEIGHFLHLATKCNPTILETFLAPVEDGDEWGMAMRNLFPYIWNTNDVVNAFIGYGLNQRKKFLDDKDNRANKYACAYMRTLYQAWKLINTGGFPVNVADTNIGKHLIRWRKGDWTRGEVIDFCHGIEQQIREDLKKIKEPKETDYEVVNKFLLDVRRAHWEPALCLK